MYGPPGPIGPKGLAGWDPLKDLKSELEAIILNMEYKVNSAITNREVRLNGLVSNIERQMNETDGRFGTSSYNYATSTTWSSVSPWSSSKPTTYPVYSSLIKGDW